MPLHSISGIVRLDGSYVELSSGTLGGSLCPVTQGAERDSKYTFAIDGTIRMRKEGRPSAGLCACTVLAAALDRWGLDFPKHLAGDFAVAAWQIARKSLVCARDTTGARSFYYVNKAGTLAFASDLETLFRTFHLRRSPDPATIGRHLANQSFDSSSTLYEGVKRLPPGHVLVVENGSVRVQPYWTPSAVSRVQKGSEKEYGEEFLNVFRRAVAERVGSDDVRPAILLSGGVDSSAIACVAPKRSIACAYSLVSRLEAFDESKYANEVAEHCGIPITEISYEQAVTPLLSIDDWDSHDVLYSPMMRFVEALTRQASADGRHVLLTGFGGDELLAGGIEHLRQLARRGSWVEFWKRSASDAEVWGESRWTLLWEHALRPLLPRLPLPVASHARRFPSFVTRTFLENHGVFDQAEAEKTISDPEQASIVSALNEGWNIVVQLEEISSIARRFGVVLSHPFLDRDVMEYVLGIPQSQRCSPEGDRLVLRNALRGIMPERVRARVDKSSLTKVIDRELRQKQIHRIRKLFLGSRLAALGAVDGRELLKAYDAFVCGSNKVHASEFETVVGLELWLRRLDLS